MASSEKPAEKIRKQYGKDAFREWGRKGGKKAQELHPELRRFEDKEFAKKARKKRGKNEKE